MQKLKGIFIAFLVFYFGVIFYGKYATCRDLGGVLTVGLARFVCVDELKAN